jgi:hypothetical protein
MKDITIAFFISMLFCCLALAVNAQSNTGYTSVSIVYTNTKLTMFVLSPSGTKEEFELTNLKNGSKPDEVAISQVEILIKLNELKAKGWKVFNVNTVTYYTTISVTTYLLEYLPE